MARNTQRKLNNRFIRDKGYGPRRQVTKVLIDKGDGGGSSTISWGGITGTLTDQADLLSEFNKKFNKTGGIISGQTDALHLRATGISNPTTGSGVEIRLTGGGTIGDVVAYNRDTPGFLPLRLRGSTVSLLPDNVERLQAHSTGVNVTGDLAISGTVTASLRAELATQLVVRGISVPTSGSGLELQYNTAITTGDVLAYNRDTSTYLPVRVRGSQVDLRINDVNRLSATTAGVDVTGSLTASGAVTGASFNNTPITTTASGGNIGFGTGAMGLITTGSGNIGVGQFAGEALTTGVGNVAVGTYTLRVETTGNSNTAIGHSAGSSQAGASENSLVGSGAGSALTTGGRNSVIGRAALQTETTGAENVAVGFYALRLMTGGGLYNTVVGTYAGYDVTLGHRNTFVGRNTGRGITTGERNTIIGGDVTGLTANTWYNVILADGVGNKRFHWDGSAVFTPQGPHTHFTAAAVLTAAQILGGLITTDFGAATALTLPTGTDMDAAISNVGINQAFEWSLINTGTATGTISANTGHTLIGGNNPGVKQSARFRTRKTAANTFITYRIG